MSHYSIRIVSVVACLVIASMAFAQDSNRVRRIGQITLTRNAVAVSVVGNYAYVTTDSAGLRIVDISNPILPQEIGFYYTADRSDGIAVSGNYAYVTAGYSGYLQVINISNPASPQLVGSFTSTTGYFGQIVVEGNFAYVANNYGLQIIDISSPNSPQGVSQLGGLPVHVYSIAKSGNYCFLSSTAFVFQIVSVSDPASPQYLGSCNGGGSEEGITIVGNYAYVAEGGRQGNGNQGLRIFDVSNTGYPHSVGFYSSPSDAENVTVSGNFAYLASGTSGLRVVDISNPVSPFEVGYYNTPGHAASVKAAGGYIYIADTDFGMSIYQFSMLNLLRPNGGETSSVGVFDTVRWTGDAVGNINIELNRTYPSPNWEMLFANTPNDSSQQWTVTGPYTNSARIRITSVENPAIGDTSDANFTIGIIPATPGNLAVTLQGEDALLAWARVDTSLSGFPITVERYLIFYRDDGSEPWQYLWATFGANATNFTHTSVVRHSPAMFYEVRAWIGDTDSFDRILRDIPPGLREDVFLQRIGGNVSAPIVKQVK